MSIFGNIMSAIFGSSATTAPSVAPASPGGAAPPTTSAAASTPTPVGAAPADTTVDVEAILIERAKQKKEKLDWRHSIVDLMKVLDLDSSLSARKQLAEELRYSGDPSDSAAMNIWLHKQVMQRIAANGGKVPAELH